MGKNEKPSSSFEHPKTEAQYARRIVLSNVVYISIILKSKRQFEKSNKVSYEKFLLLDVFFSFEIVTTR